jgi:hypothetical protein
MDDVRASLKFVLAILLCVNVTAAVSVSTEAGVTHEFTNFRFTTYSKPRSDQMYLSWSCGTPRWAGAELVRGVG